MCVCVLRFAPTANARAAAAEKTCTAAVGGARPLALLPLDVQEEKAENRRRGRGGGERECGEEGAGIWWPTPPSGGGGGGGCDL